MNSTATDLPGHDLPLDPPGPLTGPVLRPGDPDYAAEVSGFNLAYHPAPALVVGAATTEDVSVAVRWGARLGLRVIAQSTGHGLYDDRAGTLMVTTRRLTGVTVDAEGPSPTARVAAGARWRDVIAATAPYGLAPLSGSSSSVGAVGYTLGGGIGVLARQYGFAADHVRALTLVTADGTVRRLTADAPDGTPEADLFWAIRGGRVGFGIVTELEIALFPVTRLHGGGVFFDITDAPAVLHAWRVWAPQLPREITTSVALLQLPPDPQLPPPLSGRFVVHLRFASTGPADQAEALLAPMRASAPIVMDTVGELPYAAVDAVHMDPPLPLPALGHGFGLSDLTPEAVDALVDTCGAASGSALVIAEIRLLGGALADAPVVPNAVPGRRAAYGFWAIGVPMGPAAEIVPAHLRRAADALAPWRDGGQPNFVDLDGDAGVRALYPDAVRARLARIAAAHDPADVLGGTAMFG